MDAVDLQRAEAQFPKFERVSSADCDCCEETLRVAIHRLGASRLYTLAVNPRELSSAWNKVRLLTNAALALQINVIEDPDLDPFGWYLSANGRSIGSEAN